MTTNSDAYVARQVLEQLRTQRPELAERISICKGTRMPFPFNNQRVLRVTLSDGQYLQVPFLPKGNIYGAVVGDLVDHLLKWKVRDDPRYPVRPD